MAFKQKSIDEIKGIKEMGALMDALEISYEGFQTLDEMKSHLKDELSRKETPSWSPGQAFSVLSNAKAEDDRKREVLMEFYTKADRLLSSLDDKMVPELGNFKEEVKQHKEQLGQSEYFLLVAGETSSGKSSLLNLILGKNILPSFHNWTTSTICEVKDGKKPKFVVHLKDKDPETGQDTKTVDLQTPTELTGSSEQSFREQISPYVTKCSTVKKIELFWPHHPLLEKGLVIVDSPGVGESDEMDEMVSQYLPKAFAFIYVINSANAGGVQKDRLEKLFEKAKKAFGVEKDKAENEMPLGLLLLSKCALFVCNKWDCVPDDETQQVEDEVTTKLRTTWPGVTPKSQIIYMSIRKANTAKSYGKITDNFLSLMDGMSSMIMESIGARLELHWRRLECLLSWIIERAELLVNSAFQDRDELMQKKARISDSLNTIENKQDEIIADLQKCLNKYEDDAVQRLFMYLSSEDVKARFASWEQEEVPKEGSSWEKTAENITNALSSRFQENIKQWEEDNGVFANVSIYLQQQFQKYYDDVEGQLQDILGAVPDDRGDVDTPENTACFHSTKTYQFAMKGFVFSVFALKYARSFIKGLGLFTGVLVLADVSVIIYQSLKDKRKSGQYKNDMSAFMAHESKNYLAVVTNKEKLKEAVKNHLKPGELLLRSIEAQFPNIIQASKTLLQDLEVEKRSTKERKDFYQKILDEGSQHKGNLAVFVIKEVRATEMSLKELEWNEMSPRLGSGTFGDVYEGTMRRQESVKTVALKVSREKLDRRNAGEILNEMENLSLLNHRHIVKFFGMALLKKEVDNVRIILVMEKCKGNLKSHIFRDLASVPGNSGNPVDIINVCRWAEEITNGLAYIHALGIVHRDLKLENILLSVEDSVKIADVGLAKREVDIRGTVAGTYAYMAPEVFHSQRYGREADIYSLGIILWEMWYGQLAFDDGPWISPQDLFNWVDEGNRPVDTKGYKKPPIRWEHLMTQCWKGNPKERPTAEKCNKEITCCM